MSKLIGALTALTALTVCLLNGIEPVTTIVRALVAFAIGHVVGAVWEGISQRMSPRRMSAVLERQDKESPDAEAA
ncbi:MAG: hypothetical protein LCH41_02580 [Armatimonadetes bacterium]|nr:hypothetical protein [Armatimonadota bacterium]